MTQNRPPPAYQEYAAQLLANRDFRVLSLSERGLLWTIRLECWVNQSLPADSAMLGRVLGFSADEVRHALPNISAFLGQSEDSLTCPELDDYRQHLATQRQKQSDGGKRGAARTNGRRKSSEIAANTDLETDSTTLPSISRDKPHVLSSVQSSSAKPRKAQPSEEGIDPWVKDYEQASKGH